MKQIGVMQFSCHHFCHAVPPLRTLRAVGKSFTWSFRQMNGLLARSSEREEHNMPAPKATLNERLAPYRQIKVCVIGRKSAQTISIPVWFVSEGEKLYLLTVRGSEAHW